MTDIQSYIMLEMVSRGIQKFKTIPIQIEVTSPEMYFDLNKYIYLFCSKDIDVVALPTLVEISSPDNVLQFTKTTLQNTESAQYQFFTEEMQIETKNFGSDNPADFVPFMLEFWKIIPEN